MKTSLEYQPELFDEDEIAAPSHARFNGRSGAFGDNMSLPVHRWYRYSAGFSADWVRSLVRERCNDSSTFTVIDPFCGIGTTLLACDAEGIQSWGFETHPFVHRIANAKIRGIHADLSSVRNVFQQFVDRVGTLPPVELDDIPPLLVKCYTREALSELLAMRDLFLTEYDKMKWTGLFGQF